MANKTTIKIGHLRLTDHLVLGITKNKLESGQDKFEYVDLQTQYFAGWNPLKDALKDGSVDAAFILAPLAMDLFSAGAKIRLILFGHRDGSVIIKNKRANIEKIEDFKGKTVLIPHYLSIHHLIFDRLLREKGLTVGIGKDVIFETVAPSEIPEIIADDEEGNIGGFIVAEPYASQVVLAGSGEEFALSKDIWPKHPCCILVVKDEIVGKNPDAVQELTNSFVQSGFFIEQNPTAAAEIGATFLDQKVEVVNRVLTLKHVSTGELFPSLEPLDAMQNYLSKVISPPAMTSKIDLEKFVDTRFAKEAGAK